MIEDLVLGVRIDAGKRVIKNQDARIANQCTCDRGALLLSAGERDASFANHGVVAFRETFDVGGDVSGVRGVPDLVVRSRVDAEGDVLADAYR